MSTINLGALLLTAMSFWRILESSIERHYIIVIAFAALMFSFVSFPQAAIPTAPAVGGGNNDK